LILRLAHLFDGSLACEISGCAAVHDADVVLEILMRYPLLKEKIEVLVELGCGSGGEVEGPVGIVDLEPLFECDALLGGFLSVLLYQFSVRDADLGFC